MIDDSQLVATLLEEGLADQATLDQGIEKTAASGTTLYETLIAANLVDEPKLVGVMSRLLDVPSREIEPAAISFELRSLVPSSMAHRNRVIPLEHGENGDLLLAMADPQDQLAIDEIATHTGSKIQPILVGPAALSDALSSMYPVSEHQSDVASAVLDAFDDFEVGDYMDDVLPGDEWSDYFDDEEAEEIEDSTILSRDMQDRPSTDVLAEDDIDAAVASADEDFPEIEIIEELGQPIQKRAPSPYASLDEWEVDDAIGGASEIVTAGSAEDLFGGSKSPVDALIEEEADETSNLEFPEEISESHTDALETQSSRTAVGVGIDHLREPESQAGRSRPKKKKRVTVESTGKTSVGVRRGDSEAEGGDDELDDDGNTDSKAPEEQNPHAEAAAADALRYENTDYGALGRAILKSGPTSKDKAAPPAEAKKKNGTTGPAKAAEPVEEDVDDGAEDADDETNVTDGALVKKALEAEDERPTNPQALEPQEIEPEAIEPLPEPKMVDGKAEAQAPKPNTSIVVALFEDDDAVPEPIGNRAPTHARSPKSRKEPEVEEQVEEQPAEQVEEEPEIEDQEPAERTEISEAVVEAEPASEPEADVEPDAGTRPRLTTPSLLLPDDIDSSGLALALANLLVDKGILSAEEIFALAHSLSKKK